MAGFAGAYDAAAPPPWDIGRPQPDIAALAERGEISGSVLDVGCGTGENALHFAALGHEVVGLDAVPKAIDTARRKAMARHLPATFVVGDALDLAALGRAFGTIVDSGLFHVFDDADRARYVESLHGALAPGGRYHVLAFSEREPADWGGPRRITEAEIRRAFAAPAWRVERVERAIYHTNIHPDPPGGAQAWLATARRA